MIPFILLMVVSVGFGAYCLVVSVLSRDYQTMIAAIPLTALSLWLLGMGLKDLRRSRASATGHIHGSQTRPDESDDQPNQP